MKVILKVTVPKLGKQGQVVKVADGYARNFLFPRGLAIAADRKQLAVLEARQARLAAKDASTLEGAKALREKLQGQVVKIEGKAGHATTKLFGAITAQNIADAIKDQLGVALEKKQVALIDPIKRLGNHQVHLDLHREVDAVITVRVFDPAAPLEEEQSSETSSGTPAEGESASPAGELEPKKRSKKAADGAQPEAVQA